MINESSRERTEHKQKWERSKRSSTELFAHSHWTIPFRQSPRRRQTSEVDQWQAFTIQFSPVRVRPAKMMKMSCRFRSFSFIKRKRKRKIMCYESTSLMDNSPSHFPRRILVEKFFGFNVYAHERNDEIC